MILNRKVSINKLSPITRNKREKKRENVRAKVSIYDDVVKKGIEENRMEDADAVKKNTEGKNGRLRAISEEKLKRMYS